MGSLILPPTWVPPQAPIPLGTSGQVLTVTSGGGLAFETGGGGGGTGGIIGSYLAYASSSGTLNNVSPTDFPGESSAPVGRLGVTLPDGAATWTGLAAGNDGQILQLINLDSANSLTLNTQDSGSSAANQFLGPADITLPPGDSILAVYTAGSVKLWVLTP